MNDAQFDDIWNKYDQVKKTKTLNNGKVWPANPIERKQRFLSPLSESRQSSRAGGVEGGAAVA